MPSILVIPPPLVVSEAKAFVPPTLPAKVVFPLVVTVKSELLPASSTVESKLIFLAPATAVA